MASAWNLFTKKIYQEGRAKNKNYSFKQALTDASARKSEMGSSSKMDSQSKSRKFRKSKKCCPCPKKRTRKNRGKKFF